MKPRGIVLLPLLIIIVAVAAVGTTAYFIWQANQSNANTSNGNMNAVVVQNTNANSNTNQAANANVVIANTNSSTTVQEIYWVNEDEPVFYHRINGDLSRINTPFSVAEYHGESTYYGYLFWKRGTQKMTLLNKNGQAQGFTEPIPYEGGTDPEFIFYNYSIQEFITLPEYVFKKDDQVFERIYSVTSSINEEKLLIEIGEYDTQNDAFILGLLDSQPVVTRGLVYNISSNDFESGDPLSEYLQVLDIKSTLSSGIAWNSKDQIAVATPRGEGCGPYDTITFINLRDKTKISTNNQTGIEFEEMACNPKNGSSPYGQWFVLYGLTNNTFGIQLYKNTFSNQPVQTKLIHGSLGANSYIKQWDTSKEFPKITFDNKATVDFN